MKEQPSRREEIEKQIDKELNDAQVHAIVPYLLSKAIGVFDTKKGEQFYFSHIEPYKMRYNQANETLRQIEEEEEFPNVRRYIKLLLEIRDKIPSSLREQAYYPYAGHDIFWAAAFQDLVMEDKNYNVVQVDHTFWWNDYKLEALERLTTALKSRGLIPQDNKITYIQHNSETGETISHYNQSSTTLIYKAGWDINAFIKKTFKNKRVEFGAIIVSHDNSRAGSLEKLLSYHNYQRVHELHPPSIVIPWALPLSKPKVYLKT